MSPTICDGNVAFTKSRKRQSQKFGEKLRGCKPLFMGHSKPLYIIYAESIAAVAKKQLELLSRFDTSVTRAGLMYVWP